MKLGVNSRWSLSSHHHLTTKIFYGRLHVKKHVLGETFLEGAEDEIGETRHERDKGWSHLVEI